MVNNSDWNKFTSICIATRWTEANGIKDVLNMSMHLPSDSQVVMVGLEKSQIANLPTNIIGLQ